MGRKISNELCILKSILDARIAKVLARLVGLKEFKRTPAGAATRSITVSTNQLSTTGNTLTK